jgi:hypothetical protein
MADPAPPEELEPFLRSARDYVRRAVGMELDGSETSLAFLDHYLEKVWQDDPMKRDVLDLAAASLGAYFGEVLRKKFGGRWTLGADPAAWVLELGVGALRLHPVGMAAAALIRDEVEGHDASFHTKAEWMGPLGEALASSPPVDKGYYYSFTGRMETLEHAAEVIAELERRARERN